MLCTMADRLRRAIRPDDLAVRLGGDEFILITPFETNLESRMNRLRNMIEGPSRVDGFELELRVSLGWAALDPADPHVGIAAADAAMYQDKMARQGHPNTRRRRARRNLDALPGSNHAPDRGRPASEEAT